MKLLSQRLGALAYDLVVVGDVSPRRAQRMAARLTECADHFLGAALRSLAVVDPQAAPSLPLPADLARLVALQLAGLASPAGAADMTGAATASPFALPDRLALSARPAPARQGTATGRLN